MTGSSALTSPPGLGRQPAGHHHELMPPGHHVLVRARRERDSRANANANGNAKAQLWRWPTLFTWHASRLSHRRHPLHLMHAIGRLGNRLLSSYSRQHEQ
jgi:hypothetical protein